MTIEAHMADGKVLVFPDGTSNSVIESTVKRLIAEKAAQQATDVDSISVQNRTMKTYEIKAPDGNTYLIEGPDNATQEEANNALLQRHPEAGIPVKQVGMNMESISLLVIFVMFGVGIAFFLERELTKYLKTKGQKIWLGIAASLFGLGLMGVFNQLFVIPMNGLKADHTKVFNYIFFNILFFPALIGLVIWRLQVKAASVSIKKLKTSHEVAPSLMVATAHELQSGEDLYAQALLELEGGKRIDGIWAKCFADADGVENVAKAQYIKIRVSQLQKAVK